MKKPDAIFFDWDGTLIDGFDVIVNALNTARVTFDLPSLTREEASSGIRKTSKDSFPEIFGSNALRAEEVFYTYVREHHLRDIRKMDGADELLTLLYKKGIPMGIISNKLHEVLGYEIEHMGWSKYFTSWMGAGVMENDKPAPDPLIQSAYDIGMTPDIYELWYIGDTETDMQAAKAAKFTPVFIAHGLGKRDIVTEYQPALTVSDTRDLIAHLQNLI